MKIRKKTVITILITAVVTAVITGAVKDVLFVSGNKSLAKMSMISDILKDYCLFDVDKEKMGDYAMIGMVAAAEDPYTAYYPKEEFKSYSENLVTDYVGIGAYLGADTKSNSLVVISTMEGSPSEKAGLKSGDVIVSIDGKAYSANELSEAASYLKKGDIGSKVTMQIEREGKENFDITLERQTVIKETVKSKMLKNNTGYIRITEFESKSGKDAKSTYEAFCENLDALNTAGMKSLILDLRDNPGGDLQICCDIADKLLPECLITYTEDKRGKKEEFKSNADCIDLPTAILVNGGSASASEVLTGALRDNKNATVIGTKTFGKGIVQNVIPFPDGSGMSVTIAKYYVPSGVCIHGVGIEPEIRVELESDKPIADLTIEEDTQLQKALAVLSE